METGGFEQTRPRFLYLYFLSILVEGPRQYLFGSENLEKTLQPSSSLHPDFSAFFGDFIPELFCPLANYKNFIYFLSSALGLCQTERIQVLRLQTSPETLFFLVGICASERIQNFPVFGRFHFPRAILATQRLFLNVTRKTSHILPA